MTAPELWRFINNGELDFEFGYKNKIGSICLCYLPKVYVVYGENAETETTLENLMDCSFLDGKSLNEVATEVELYG